MSFSKNNLLEELKKRDAGTTFGDLIYKIHPIDLGSNPYMVFADKEAHCIPLEIKGFRDTRGICMEVMKTRDV